MSATSETSIDEREGDSVEIIEAVGSDGRPGVEEIEVRAYEIYLSGEGGDELEHWLRAERELLGRHVANATTDDCGSEAPAEA